jgi:6-pyruvoyltetrahydropterin/6-carboxytetrahydropterin synthase
VNVELTREFTFEAAHRLPNVPSTHKCSRMHGHSYRAVVTVAGPIDPAAGWLIDFGELDAICRPVREQLDHHVLNELDGMENATAEVLTQWIYDRLKPNLPILTAVTVWETPRNSCTYRG